MQFNRDNAATRRKQGQKRIHNTVKGDDLSLGRDNDSPRRMQVQEMNAEKIAVSTQYCDPSETISRLNNVYTPEAQNDLKDTPYISKRQRQDYIVVHPTEIIEIKNESNLSTTEVQSNKEPSNVSTNDSEHEVQLDRVEIQTRSEEEANIYEARKESQHLSPRDDPGSLDEFNLDEPTDSIAEISSLEASKDIDLKVQFNRHNLTTLNKMISSKKQLEISQMQETPRNGTFSHKEKDYNAKRDAFPNHKATTSEEVLERQVQFDSNNSSTQSKIHGRMGFEEEKFPGSLLSETPELISFLETQQQEINNQKDKTLATSVPGTGEFQFNRHNSSTRAKQGIKTNDVQFNAQNRVQSTESPNSHQTQENRLVVVQINYTELIGNTQANDSLVNFNQHNASTERKMRLQKENNDSGTTKICGSTIMIPSNVQNKDANHWSNGDLYSTSSSTIRTDEIEREFRPTPDAFLQMNKQKQISIDNNEFVMVQRSEYDYHDDLEQVSLTRKITVSHEFDNRENSLTVQKRHPRAERRTAVSTEPQIMKTKQRPDAMNVITNPSEAHVQLAAELSAEKIKQDQLKARMRRSDNLTTSNKTGMQQPTGQHQSNEATRPTSGKPNYGNSSSKNDQAQQKRPARVSQSGAPSRTMSCCNIL
ncbi:uncharacterized protein LOC134214105 [Armigeres subalbatus]|uniref:uncharacterized protein LOC134214105 n=1 Tax=Armigeres subalbatus TaxID=124917 RepID=UPI002ED2D2DA